MQENTVPIIDSSDHILRRHRRLFPTGVHGTRLTQKKIPEPDLGQVPVGNFRLIWIQVGGKRLSSYLSLADTAWLHVEQPSNLMMVTGLLLLDRNPDHPRLESILRERLVCYDRFSMRVVEPATGVGLPHWEIDPDFDLNSHLNYISLPQGTEQDLWQRAGHLMSLALPRCRPLWDMTVFEDLEHGAAVLVRLHHAIADGIALMRVLLNLAERPDRELPVEKPQGPPVPKPGQGTWSNARRWAHHLLQEGHDLLFHPQRTLNITDFPKSLAHVMTMSPDKDNPLRGALGIQKVAAVSGPLVLTEIKVACRRMGCTVNDFLMSTLAGALGLYLRRTGEVASDLEIRTVVPVDLRKGQVEGLGNRFGLVFLALPVGEADHQQRLKLVHDNMDRLKNSPEALVTFELLSAAGILPANLEQTIIEWFGNKATAVVTTLKGPEEELYLGTARLTGLMYWVPQSGHLGLGVSMISYAGKVRVGVASDAGLIPHPELLVDDFQLIYHEMLGLENS